MRCTIKDIANELNLSRNTVSKALKGSAEVSAKTTQRIIDTAREMNYSFIDDEKAVALGTPTQDNILFLTKTYASDSEFWTSVLKGIEKILSAAHYRLVIGIMTDNDLRIMNFPPAVYDPNTKGIIIVELCYENVCKALLDLKLPIVTIDMPNSTYPFEDKMDVITMESKRNIRQITERLIEKGARRFSFIGDLYSANVGRGFQERYDSLCECLADHHLSLYAAASLLHETEEDYRNFGAITEKIKDIKTLPDVFICGNDWTAIQVIYTLQFLGYKIPKDVSIVGFDNIPASERIIPALTTVNTPKEYLGIAAAKKMIDRLKHPEDPFLYARYSTELILRDSTI